jgi:thiosulfate/3-mercaptopyruvate sulfurtransferase
MLRIVDVRWYLKQPGAGRRAYDGGHIPGAVFIDLDTDLSAASGPGRHPLPEPDDFRRRMMAAGISTDTFVVAYDDTGGTTAARLWWMLDNLGHRGGVAVLDGGIQAWVAAGLALESVESSYPAATSLDLAGSWQRIIDRDQLAARLGRLTILDARAAERYRGEVEPIDPAAGHIPTAISAPTSGNLGVDGRFLAPEVLRARFGELGATSIEVVTYCGSGTSACHNVLAMRVAGIPDPILYPGSFSDWSTAGMPIATGSRAWNSQSGVSEP